MTLHGLCNVLSVIFNFVDPQKDRYTLLQVCKLFNDVGVRKLDPSVENNYAILWASHTGHIDSARFLLGDSRDRLAKRTTLSPASRASFDLLLPKVVDPSMNNNEAIQTASQNGHAGVVKLLLADSRVDPSMGYNYAIRTARMNGHTQVVELLLADPRVNPL